MIIDLPQVVDLVGNPTGMDFLMRDCRNVCALVPRARASTSTSTTLFGELLAARVLTRPCRAAVTIG